MYIIDIINAITNLAIGVFAYNNPESANKIITNILNDNDKKALKKWFMPLNEVDHQPLQMEVLKHLLAQN